LDLSQWSFFVASMREIDSRHSKKKSLSLKSVMEMQMSPCNFASLRQAIYQKAGSGEREGNQ